MRAKKSSDTNFISIEKVPTHHFTQTHSHAHTHRRTQTHTHAHTHTHTYLVILGIFRLFPSLRSSLSANPVLFSQRFCRRNYVLHLFWHKFSVYLQLLEIRSSCAVGHLVLAFGARQILRNWSLVFPVGCLLPLPDRFCFGSRLTSITFGKHILRCLKK